VIFLINHNEKHINYNVIENRLLKLAFVKKVDSNPNLKQINIQGINLNKHYILIKNTLFNIGYNVNAVTK